MMQQPYYPHDRLLRYALDECRPGELMFDQFQHPLYLAHGWMDGPGEGQKRFIGLRTVKSMQISIAEKTQAGWAELEKRWKQ